MAKDVSTKNGMESINIVNIYCGWHQNILENQYITYKWDMIFSTKYMDKITL